MTRLVLVLACLLAFASPAYASIVCDGTHLLEAPSNGAYAGSGFSISLWVKKASDGSVQGLAGLSAAESMDVEFLGTNVVRGRTAGGSSLGDSTTTITGAAWHHLVTTFNPGTGAWVVYIDDDGSPRSSTSGTSTLAAGNFDICNAGSLGFAPNGTKIALVAAWSSVLSAANVTSLKATCSPESVAGGSNVASWHLTNGALTDASATANNQVNANALAGSTDEPTPCGGATPQTFGFYHRRAS